MKKFLALAMACLLVFALFACTGKTEEGSTETGSTTEKPLIGVCMIDLSQSIYETQAAALVAAFPDCDVQVAVADSDVSTQINQINTFALMGAKMIVIVPTEIEALTDAIIKAHDAGCKIVISGAANSNTALDGYYDTCTVSDEYLIGCYTAMVAKTWVESHLEQLGGADGNWEMAFLESSLNDDCVYRTNGMESVINPYLTNRDGAFVDAMGNVVDEANKVANPAYSEVLANHYKGAKAEMDMADTGITVASILTTNPNTRVFLCFNSLASTNGGQYVVDHYADQLSEFAFFSAGVLGSEPEYLVGSLSETEGTRSVFRGACQFGSGEVSETLARLAKAVMYGQLGVDYVTNTPDGVALWWTVDKQWSGEEADYMLHFNIGNEATVQPYDPVALIHDAGTTIYWDSINGFAPETEEETPAATAAPEATTTAAAAPVQPGEYAFTEEVANVGTFEWKITLNADSSYIIAQANEGMGNPTWTGTSWVDNGDGTFTTVAAEGSSTKIAGFWEADGSIVWAALNDNHCVPVKYDGYADTVAAFGLAGAAAAVTTQAGEYKFTEEVPSVGTFEWTITLKDDGSFVIAQANEGMGNPTWTGTSWVDNGDGTFTTVAAEGSSTKIAAFWQADGSIDWVNNGDGTVTPVGY